MSNEKSYDEASKVTVERGEVHLDGPDGVDVLLTPDAAIETSDRLLKAGLAAHGQRVIEDRRKRDHLRPQ